MTFPRRRSKPSTTDRIDAEFQLHIDLTTDDLIADGYAPNIARREAVKRFGRFDRLRRECLAVAREHDKRQRRAASMESLVQDMLHAFRGMRRAPAFAIAIAATLALGIGATTTVFSVVDTLVLRQLPYPASDRLVIVGSAYDPTDPPRSVSPMNFFDWRDRNDVFEETVASRLESKTVVRDGYPEMVLGAGVSAGFFELLGVTPALGRPILPSDDRPGGDRAVVLSHGLWQAQSGGDPAVIGRSISLTGVPYTVVGVMPPSFHPPEALYHAGVALWFPLAHVDDDLTERDGGFLQVMARLEPGTSVELARESMNVLQQGIYASLPAPSERTAEVRASQLVAIEPMRQHTVGETGAVMWIFLGSVFLLLAIACANAANLLLARSADRARELALRTALGARRTRIARQLLTEAVALSVTAGMGGALLAVAGVRAFVTFAPRSLPRLGEVTLDVRVLAFTAGVSVVTGVLFGLAPVVQLSNSSARDALHEGSLTASAGRHRNRLRRALVAFESAVTLVLLVGAGLLINSFVRLVSIDPGFDPTGVARMSLYIGDHYDTGERRAAFFEDLVTRVRGLPGVMSAAATDNLPMTENRSLNVVSLAGSAEGERTRISVHRTTPDYLATLRIPLLSGRDFTTADRQGTEPVAIVNEAAAQVLWPDANAIGQRFKFGPAQSGSAWITVVGVAGTVHQIRLGNEDGPAVYLSQAQAPFRFGNLVVRASGDVTTLMPLLRGELLALDPRLPAEEVGLLVDQLAVTLTQPRFNTLLLTSFGVLALLIATVGVYGAISYIVGQRSHELGIRMALGARGHDVLQLVMRQGLWTVATGVVIGGVAALALSRTLGGFVYGISTTDWPTYTTVAAVLLATSALACWIPARRAARVNPIQTLRTE